MTRYLVTGGAGFVGSHIAARLVEDGEQVRVLDNLCTGKMENLAAIADQIDFHEGDLCNSDDVSQAVADVDIIFHQAALASVPRSLETPLDTHAACVTGTVELLTAAKDAGVRRVVYAASSSAYGDQPFSSKREDDLPSPLSPYAAAKLAGEFYCQAFYESFDLETVAIRYFNVFGPRQDPESEYAAVIPKFITLMLAGERPTIFGDGRQSRDFTYIDNVVAGNLLAAHVDGAAGRTFNVACGHKFTLRDLVDAINDLLGTDIEPIYAPARVGDVHESLADITSARTLLGYHPTVEFRDGLQKTIDAFASDSTASSKSVTARAS